MNPQQTLALACIQLEVSSSIRVIIYTSSFLKLSTTTEIDTSTDSATADLLLLPRFVRQALP